jgi:short-subunit dehydrogenase
MSTNKQRPILVTGASTGIGFNLVNYLAERGHSVYGTARTEADLQKLADIKNVTPIQLDVRKPDQIQAGLNLVTQQGTGLYGLVNNAGVGALGMFSTWTDEELFDIFDVNVFGVHRVTNAFVRLLIQSQGRIVNIGSQGGMVTSKYYGPYTMTKHAIEAYTDALGMELESYGVKVSVVQPGGVITNIGANSIPKSLTRFERAEPPFKKEADQVLESFSKPPEPKSEDEPESETHRKPSPPEVVSAAVYEALFSEKPKTRYLVGTKWEGDRVIHGLIQKLLDENDNPQHNYSRDELVAILDQYVQHRES